MDIRWSWISPLPLGASVFLSHFILAQTSQPWVLLHPHSSCRTIWNVIIFNVAPNAVSLTPSVSSKGQRPHCTNCYSLSNMYSMVQARTQCLNNIFFWLKSYTSFLFFNLFMWWIKLTVSSNKISYSWGWGRGPKSEYHLQFSFFSEKTYIDRYKYRYRYMFGY